MVADTGQGINPDFLPYVFDRFRQEKTGTTRPHGGLGLGLAIVRQLVELHGGTVRAESAGEGSGSVFTVTLPLARTDSTIVSPADSYLTAAARDDALPPLDGVRVLVVDDDATAREMVRAALEHCGALVASAASAREARRELTAAFCDVLLIDIAMPDEDGYTLIRDLRISGVVQPAVALTAQARDVDRRHALEAGFDLHLTKPVEARALAQAVAALRDASRALPN
jgi:CheY-like chemotaxis protein